MDEKENTGICFRTKWHIAEVNGKLASISTGFRRFGNLVADILKRCPDGIDDIRYRTVDFDVIRNLKSTVIWDDIILFGTPFQINVWKHLYALTHYGNHAAILSYSDFAKICGSPSGTRAVAHAVGLNPLPVIIPCHLIVPKESAERIDLIERNASETLFKEEGLEPFANIDLGEFSLGKEFKRELISLEFSSFQDIC